MKTFNVTAQAYDNCSINPNQMILINEVIHANNPDEAEKKFAFNLLVEDIVVNKILSTEEISKVAS